MNDLTTRQKLFAVNYLETGNATKAAIAAGYSPKSAAAIGAENLTKPNISAYIGEEPAKIMSEKILNAQQNIEFLSDVVRGEVVEEVASNGKKLRLKTPIAQRVTAAINLLKIQGQYRERVEVEINPLQQFMKALEEPDDEERLEAAET